MKTNDKKDAERYRFLRSNESRNHNNHTRRCLTVGIEDWGKRLGARRGTMSCAFWSVREVIGREMDREIDKAMKP